MRVAAAKASLRAARGVVPACASLAQRFDDVAPAALDAGDHADGLARILEPRALLDMDLDIAVERKARRPSRIGAGRGLERLGQRLLQHDALPVLDGQHVVEPAAAGEHRRAHGAGLEARAFLVGPGDGDQRPPGPEAGILQRFQRLERRQHAVHAVEAPAGRLAVHVRAAHHRRCAGLAALAAHEEVADGVGEDRKAARLCPGREQVPGCDILGRQRLAVDAALLRAAQLRHVGMALPQAILANGLGTAHAFPPTCWSVYSGPIVAHQSGGPHAQSSRPQPRGLRRRHARPAMAGRGPHRRQLRAELRGGRREHHPERRPRVRGLPVRDARRHADPGRPRPLDRIAVRVRQPRRLLAHPAAVRRTQHALHLMGGRPSPGAQPRRRQGDGRGRPRGGEPWLALDQLQGFHARAGARPHEKDGGRHQSDRRQAAGRLVHRPLRHAHAVGRHQAWRLPLFERFLQRRPALLGAGRRHAAPDHSLHPGE